MRSDDRKKQMITNMHNQAKQLQFEKEFQRSCDVYSTLLWIMSEYCDPNDNDLYKVYVDYASALIDNYIEEKLNAAKSECDNITRDDDREKINVTEEDNESDNSYGDDPILGNPVIIKTNVQSDEESEKKETISSVNDNNHESNSEEETEQKYDTNQKDANDIEIAWEILELARIYFEKNSHDKTCIYYLIKARNLVSIIFKENENPEESLKESAICKQMYNDNNIDDPRLYADICNNRAFCYLLMADSENAIFEYNETIHALESLGKSAQLTSDQLNDIHEIIEGVNAQIKMCQDSDITKESVKNDIKEFIKNWSNIPSSNNSVNNSDNNDSFHSKSQLAPIKRHNQNPNDINHLVKKKKDSS